jgi:hypothetical protein
MWDYLTTGLSSLGSGLSNAGSGMWDYMSGGLGGTGTAIDPIWGQSLIGDIGNTLGSKQGLAGLNTGIQGLNAYNQYQFNKDARDIMGRQLDMQEGAYEQDRQAYEDRQNLNF